jgi:hypothetical protein
MTRFALACCCAFAAGLAPAAAQTAPSPAPAASATAASPEAAKLIAAMSKVTSFRMQLSTTTGMGGTVTIIVPTKRTKAAFAMGPMMSEVVMADGRMYTRTNGGDWRVTDAPATFGMADGAVKAMTDASRIHVLPDRVENGTTVGVYEVTPPAPPNAPAGYVPTALSCTYDKTTYLPRTCTYQNLTQTFEGFNDPANVVDVPVVAPTASPHP